MNYKTALAQNLFLLNQNEAFSKQLEELKSKYSKELVKILAKELILQIKIGV